MSDKRRIVVVGLGSIGRRHARLLRARTDVQLELCELSEDSLQKSLSEIGTVPAHRDFHAMLATRPEVVVIATPHQFHVDQTIECLEAGAHVLCEKPVSHCLTDAQKLAETVRRYPAQKVGVAFMLHFHPGLRRLKQLIEEGALGRVVHAHARVGSYITLVNSVSRYQARLEGALLMDYAHQPDILYWLLGHKPRGAYMAGGQAGDVEFSSSPNFLSITLDFDAPMLATIHLNYLQMPQRHEYEIVGDRAWAVLDAGTGTLRIGRTETRDEQSEQILIEVDPMYVHEHNAFFDAIDGRRDLETSVEAGLVSMNIIDAAIRSWKSRQRVELT